MHFLETEEIRENVADPVVSAPEPCHKSNDICVATLETLNGPPPHPT